jgi:hypothetical protein
VKISAVLFHRVRGFRVMDLTAMVIFLALALTVYAFKTSAGAERTNIADIEDKIADERIQVRLLRDQVARLENPKRLEDRATRFADLAPIAAKQEVAPEALAQVAGPAIAGARAAAISATQVPAPQVAASQVVGRGPHP